MLKFNALANGLSRVEQEPGEKGKRVSVPGPGEPLMASGFASHCSLCFLEEEDTALGSRDPPASLNKIPPQCRTKGPVTNPCGSWWIPTGAPGEGQTPQDETLPMGTQAPSSSSTTCASAGVPQNRGMLRAGRGTEGQVRTSCCVVWVHLRAGKKVGTH